MNTPIYLSLKFSLKKKMEEGLLKKYEEEDCPGCKVEQLKRSNTGIPVKPVLFISVVTLCACMPLYNFLYTFNLHIPSYSQSTHDFHRYIGILRHIIMIIYTCPEPLDLVSHKSLSFEVILEVKF